MDQPGGKGIALLRATELQLEQICGCGRERCSACELRRQVTAYLDVALHRLDVRANPEMPQ